MSKVAKTPPVIDKSMKMEDDYLKSRALADIFQPVTPVDSHLCTHVLSVSGILKPVLKISERAL